MSQPTSSQEVLAEYLRPYQRTFLKDRSRLKICLKSRRIGMSEAVAIEALLEALEHSRRDVYLCSTSLRDAKELLRYVAKWVEAVNRVGGSIAVKANKATTLELANDSRIRAIPAKNVRGKTGTIVLDEFAFYTHDKDVWRAVRPAIESDPSLRLILISTPFGASGVFHDIWTNPDGHYDDWSRHQIDVYEAASQGFPVDPGELETQYASDVWKQEFCCKFLSDIDQYFPYELIRSSTFDPSEEDLKTGEFLFAGIDLASTRDASCLAELFYSDSCVLVPKIHCLKPAGESRDYTDQYADALGILENDDFERVAVDATGEGAQLGQDLRRKFGGSLVEEIRSSDWKTVYEDVPRLKKAMENGNLKIPNTSAVRKAFSKIQRKESTRSKRVRYEATRDQNGHADEFSAILLAYHVGRDYLQRRSSTTTTKSLGSLPSKSSGFASGGW